MVKERIKKHVMRMWPNGFTEIACNYDLLFSQNIIEIVNDELRALFFLNYTYYL